MKLKGDLENVASETSGCMDSDQRRRHGKITTRRSSKTVVLLEEMFVLLSFTIQKEICRARFMATILPSAEKKQTSSGLRRRCRNGLR